MIRNKASVHAMNRELSRMARRSDVIHDVDCIYRNTAKGHWCMFEWKYPGETPSSSGTVNSLGDLDALFSMSDPSYAGLFIVQLGTSLDSFPFDDTQACSIQHIRHTELMALKTYPHSAQSAIAHIMQYGTLM